MAARKRENAFDLPKLDEYFTTQEQRDDAKLKKIHEIPLEEIDEFPDHPFKVLDDEDMMNLAESVRKQGIITPAMIEDPESRKDPSNLHRMDKAGMPTRYNVTRQAVDEAIAKSSNLHELAMNLKSLGYTARFQANRKYWTVIPKGWEKPIRLARLGEEYTNERILARLSEVRQAIRMEPFQRKSIRPRQYLLMTRKDGLRKVGGLRGLYLRYCYELGYLPKYRKRWNRVHYLLKDDLLKCEQYSKHARLLGEYQIETREDLASFILDKNAEYEKLFAERDELRKVARRVMPEESRAEIKKVITELTEKLKALRDEIKLSEDIRERSDMLKEKIEKIDKEQEQRKEERGR